MTVQFDQEIVEAYESAALAELFSIAFDESAPPGVLGFSFVTMAGLQRVAALLAAGRPRTVLDAGCGWGGPGLFVAQELDARLVGIDSSPNAIALARARADRCGMDASFAVATLEATGQPTASLDSVVSIDALHFAHNASAAARELLRVVRPGGLLIATLWRTTRGPRRFTRDHGAVLAEAGWSLLAEEDHPEWLRAQLRLYQAARAVDNSAAADPAVRRLQTEDNAVTPFIRTGRRLLLLARRPA